MEKRVVVHVGPPKTGSSAIQHYLVKHRDNLEKLGIWYPAHALDVNNISSGNARVVCAEDEQGRLILDESRFLNLLKKFRNDSKFHTLLLSSESFFRIEESMLRLLPSIEFIAFARNPIEFVMSIYNQAVKRHAQTTPYVPTKRLNARQWESLKYTSETVPEAQFHLFAYKSALSDYSIITDVLRVLNVDEELPPPVNEKINSSYSFAAIELKRWLNQFDLTGIQLKLDQFLQHASYNSAPYRLLNDAQLNRYANQFNSFQHQLSHLLSSQDLERIEDEMAWLESLAVKDQNHSQNDVVKLIEELKIKAPALYFAVSFIVNRQKNIEQQQEYRHYFTLPAYRYLTERVKLSLREFEIHSKRRLKPLKRIFKRI